MNTVQDIREDIAPFTMEAGKCKDSTYVLKYINQARELLFMRANWKGVVETEKIESFGGILTLPNRYVKILKAKVCGTPLSFNTEWHELADNANWDVSCFRSLFDLGDKFASFRDYYRDRKAHEYRVRLISEDRDDTGKKVLIKGIDINNRQRTAEFTLPDTDFGHVDNDIWFKNFRNASKEKTKGAIRVMIYDPNNSVEAICSVFEGLDTSVSMRRYKTGTLKDEVFYLQCKRRYIPLVDETEFVEFPTDAMIQACKALTARRNKNDADFVGSLNLALEALNAEIRDDQQDSGHKLRLSRARVVTNLIDERQSDGYYGR